MQWVKTNERLPDKSGVYFVKIEKFNAGARLIYSTELGWMYDEKSTILKDDFPNDWLDEKMFTCNVCGGILAWIRGKYPGMDKRLVCPTCETEKMDQIHEISDKNYGIASKNEPVKILTA